ncbi:MAG TPA: hypothetical protein PK609_00830, partial [Candidatus Paceibacterota bacterium]|nr:hypothetical protein [Candidatus Paceibacterota bacterium]
MGLFSSGKKQARSVALIDIGSASVGGAYAHFVEGAQPIIYYTARVTIEPREGETITESMLRSLSFLERLMIEEGAPALHRETKSGAVDNVLVSVASPWQDTHIETAHIAEKRPFLFTRAHLDAVGKTVLPKDRIASGRTVIATVLNGYETANPFGKRVTRADLTVLTSSLDKAAAHAIETSLRRTFHTGEISLTAFAPVAYTVFRDLYPHQKDFIVLDVSGTATDIAFVKHGLLTHSESVPHGIHDLLEAARKAGHRAHLGITEMLSASANQVFGEESAAIERVWLEGLEEAFEKFSHKHAL